MRCKWLNKQMRFFYGDTEGKDYKLYSLGPLEIGLIVGAIVLVFGVGKLSNIGGALGKSIREFREEKNKESSTPQLPNKASNTPQLPTNESRDQGTQPAVESKEEKRD